jgi:hypothetical protein
MKTSELSRPALNWAVAKCEGRSAKGLMRIVQGTNLTPCEYTSSWSLAGPIIFREKINLKHDCYGVAATLSADRPDVRKALRERDYNYSEGASTPYCLARDDDPLVAAMRCYVYSKLGDEIEIPKELT